MLDASTCADLSTGDLRRHIGVVLQEPFLFRGTICENLVYGRPEASAAEAITVARAAQAHDFILHKPLGYDTWLGERGRRAHLAAKTQARFRSHAPLLYDPRVLILTKQPSQYRHRIREVDSGGPSRFDPPVVRTLAIAHRLSTLCDSDRIFVFDGGRLIEQGSHDELCALDGLYARLVKNQTQLSPPQFAVRDRTQNLV